jgi:hypothetical protein
MIIAIINCRSTHGDFPSRLKQRYDMEIIDEIRLLVKTCSKKLKEQISSRVAEMEMDDISYYLIYKVLGISE